MTSPPFGLIRKKDYGNVASNEYLDWFRPFAEQFSRVLKDNGSLVIDIGGSWNPGLPTRSLYHFKLLIMLCEEYGFHLAQEFYWWNPSKLPSPAEWVTVRRIRVKDAINCVWWLSKSPWPKVHNSRVLWPYSDSMNALFKNGYKARVRPSGHAISDKFGKNNGAAIPPNLIALPNTDSNSYYQKYCRDNNLPIHPARYPSELPEMFIRLLTNKNDMVVDPFGGSCMTGWIAEKLGRKWLCVDQMKEYLEGARGRFQGNIEERPRQLWDTNWKLYAKLLEKRNKEMSVRLNEKQLTRRVEAPKEFQHYKVAHPGFSWSGKEAALSKAGGKSRNN